MMRLLAVVLLACVQISTAKYEVNNAICYGDKSLFLSQSGCGASKQLAGTANFTNSQNKTGWAYLQISGHVSGSVSEEMMAFAAGWAEGMLTRPVMSLYRTNTIADYCKPSNVKTYCTRLRAYLNENIEWIKRRIAKQPKSDYWKQVKMVLYQLMGLQEGYNKRNQFKSEIRIDPMGVLLTQMSEELPVLEQVLHRPDAELRAELYGGRCSALIKHVGDDLFFSHVTWSTYNTMLRFLKRYDLPFTTVDGKPIPAVNISMSSYPGYLHSVDDFYLTSARLAITETTIGNMNKDLWEFVNAETVPAFIRTMIANRLAATGATWMDMYGAFNSGTYNNQWMVVDYKKLTGATLPDSELFYVLEQLPRYIVYDDVTSILKKQTYWPSYNVPYFPKVFNISGFEAKVVKYGDWFTHEKAPRAQIFKRDQHKVVDLKSLTKLMRYNDFMHDPLSRCANFNANCTPPYSANNAISARDDLNVKSGTYPWKQLGHRCHGATDMKAVSHKLAFGSNGDAPFGDLNFVAISGPTHDPLPAFNWENNTCRDMVKHLGQKDLQVFEPIVLQWQTGGASVPMWRDETD